MTVFEWIFWFVFFIFYFACLFTVCMLTLKKGHIILGIIGIFFPVLWLVGAVLPAKPNSKYAIDQRMRMQAQMGQMTS